MRPSVMRWALLYGVLVLVAGCRDEAPRAAAAVPSGTEASSQPPVTPTRPATTPHRPLRLDARPLAGQGQAGIRALLGTPTGCEEVGQGFRCRYAQSQTEILYIDGVADGITVGDLGDAPFAPAALARVGLPTDEDPIESDAHTMRWQNLAGFREVVLHAGPANRAARIELRTTML